MAQAVTFEITKTDLPMHGPTFHIGQERGYAYETTDHFVHFFARPGSGPNAGHTITDGRTGTLNDWITGHFGATNVVQTRLPAGHVVNGVWRPGLYMQDELLAAFSISRAEQRTAEQELHSLVEKVFETLQFIEAAGPGLDASGPKTRELLILAATEVENAWARYMRRAKVTPGKQGYSTNQYVRLRKPLHLEEYAITLTQYPSVPVMKPFGGWREKAPTRSLPWYDAYNKTKHDRTAHLSDATLMRCLEAVAANLALFAAQFGTATLYQQITPLTSLVTHLFSIELTGADPTSFYVPLIDLPPNWHTTVAYGPTVGYTRPWAATPLVV